MIGSMPRVHAFAIAAALAALCAACADPTAPAPPTPAAPTISEVFTGTLNIGGTNIHQFSVQQVGGVKVTLNDVAPSAAIQLSIGTPSTATGQCIALQGLTAVADTGVQISGTATTTGNFCISVADAGNLVEAVTYTLTVLHS